MASSKEYLDFILEQLSELDDISCGISSGAALKAAIDLAKREDNKNIVVVFPDGGDRYLSTPLFK